MYDDVEEDDVDEVEGDDDEEELELHRLRAGRIELENEVRTLRAQLDAQRRLNDTLQASLLMLDGDDDDSMSMSLLANSRESPLLTACRAGDVAMVDALLLLDRGDETEVATALQVACQHGRLEVARLLLERFGAAVARADHDSALLWACRFGDEPLVRLLLEHGADAGALAGCPLRLAVRGGFVGVARILNAHLALPTR
ncbi:MAG: hypothetical protein B7Z66_15135 [Chromatiales bacterium 21-64-14]|nr:MAG: hypothetical protein B7Z66_15135 [Chromatiales bacterium 21-64-14]